MRAVSAYSCHSKIGSRITSSRYRSIYRLFAHEWDVKSVGSRITRTRYQTPHCALSPSWAFIDRQDDPSSSLMRLCSIRPIRALCIILQDRDWPSSRRPLACRTVRYGEGLDHAKSRTVEGAADAGRGVVSGRLQARASFSVSTGSRSLASP